MEPETIKGLQQTAEENGIQFTAMETANQAPKTTPVNGFTSWGNTLSIVNVPEVPGSKQVLISVFDLEQACKILSGMCNYSAFLAIENDKLVIRSQTANDIGIVIEQSARGLEE